MPESGARWVKRGAGEPRPQDRDGAGGSPRTKPVEAPADSTGSVRLERLDPAPHLTYTSWFRGAWFWGCRTCRWFDGAYPNLELAQKGAEWHEEAEDRRRRWAEDRAAEEAASRSPALLRVHGRGGA